MSTPILRRTVPFLLEKASKIVFMLGDNIGAIRSLAAFGDFVAETTQSSWLRGVQFLNYLAESEKYSMETLVETLKPIMIYSQVREMWKKIQADTRDIDISVFNSRLRMPDLSGLLEPLNPNKKMLGQKLSDVHRILFNGYHDLIVQIGESIQIIKAYNIAFDAVEKYTTHEIIRDFSGSHTRGIVMLDEIVKYGKITLFDFIVIIGKTPYSQPILENIVKLLKDQLVYDSPARNSDTVIHPTSKIDENSNSNTLESVGIENCIETLTAWKKEGQVGMRGKHGMDDFLGIKELPSILATNYSIIVSGKYPRFRTILCDAPEIENLQTDLHNKGVAILMHMSMANETPTLEDLIQLLRDISRKKGFTSERPPTKRANEDVIPYYDDTPEVIHLHEILDCMEAVTKWRNQGQRTMKLGPYTIQNFFKIPKLPTILATYFEFIKSRSPFKEILDFSLESSEKGLEQKGRYVIMILCIAENEPTMDDLIQLLKGIATLFKQPKEEPEVQKNTSPKRQKNSDSEKKVEVVTKPKEDPMQVDEKECAICLSNPKDIVFNCGHLCCCNACAPKVNTCPLCREIITTRIKVYA